jgi:hypothetical protein
MYSGTTTWMAGTSPGTSPAMTKRERLFLGDALEDILDNTARAMILR